MSEVGKKYAIYRPRFEHGISQEEHEKENGTSPGVTIMLEEPTSEQNGNVSMRNGDFNESRKNDTLKRRMSTAVVYMLNKDSRRTSNWSIFSLRDEFKKVDIERPYQKYWLKLQRYLLFKLYIILSICNIGILILYNTTGYVEDGRLIISLIYGSSTLISVLLAGVTFFIKANEKVYYFLTFFTWIYFVALIAAVIVPSILNHSFSGTSHIPYSFLVIFALHTMVPTSRRVSVLLGILCAACDVIVTALLSEPPYESFGPHTKILQLIANSLILLCSNLTGLYLKHFTDIAHRQMFLDTRKYIEANIRYARQKESQAQEKEKLLLKIIPKHLLKDIQKSIHERLEMKEDTGKVFQDLLVARHNHVSILYADIVSFTPLTADMEPQELVHALNQLFGRFDEIAKKNKCMRIKILGDCYYCVSGLPDPIPSHARNCVIMGMQMIKVIEHIRKETGVSTLDMRIGINTGWVLSGVIGTKKWQYDVWSDDVATANHMESGGLPGKVHITKATLDELDGEFEVVPGNGKDRDSYLLENNVDTFLINDCEMKKINIDHILKGGVKNDFQSPVICNMRRRQSMVDCMGGWGAENPFDSLSQDVMEKTLPEKEEVNRRLQRAFNLEGFIEYDTHIEYDTQDRAIHSLLNPVTLVFKDKSLEDPYCNKYDSSFKFYIGGTLVIFVFMLGVQVLLIRSLPLYIFMGVGILFFVLLLILTSVKKDNNCCGPSLMKWLQYLLSKKWTKIVICFLCSTVVLVATYIPAIPCQTSSENIIIREITMQAATKIGLPAVNTTSNDTTDLNTMNWNNTSSNITDLPGDDTDQPCLFATYYIFSCMVSLISCCVFLRVSYLYKTVYTIFCLALINFMFFILFEDMFSIYDRAVNNNFISTKILGSFYTAVLFVMLVVLNMQIEQHIRMAYLCKMKSSANRSELYLNNRIKEKLLCNILPQHVADHFSNTERNKQELYHEDYRNASVLFAAIPNFKVFFSNVDVAGSECLRLLNEIISAFDSLLAENKSIEKIKTIGSTYMAAAGLGDGHDKKVDEEKAADNARNMALFARSMVYKLIELSHNAFYEYQLRIGMNHGQVLAGVVGAQKPIYDIWGDAVNIASRMESHGIIGKIQVPEQTAALLERRGIKCLLRDGGPFKIKGKKDPMNLFFVDVTSMN